MGWFVALSVFATNVLGLSAFASSELGVSASLVPAMPAAPATPAVPAMPALVVGAPAPSQTLARVQATYRKAGNIRAQFAQTFVDKLRGKQRRESGLMWAKPDGRVRWSYLDPIRKDFIYDGKTAYFYEPENSQVTVFERFQDSPLSNAVRFLWGQGNILESFEVRPCASGCDVGEAKDVVLELWPKEELPTVDHTLIVIDPKTHRVRLSVVLDPLGNRTLYHFSKVEFGVEIANKKFDFKVPKNVSILRATADDKNVKGGKKDGKKGKKETKRVPGVKNTEDRQGKSK